MDVGEKIRMGLVKRQEALSRFKEKKAAFLIAREQIKKDIEEAREIWQKTLEQIPDPPFDP